MNVLITGGSRGIGRAIVEKFVNAGHSVAFIYRSDDKAATKCSDKTGALAIKADVSDPEQVKRACTEAIAKLGDIDVLVNNAGISKNGLMTDMSVSDWKSVTDTNLSSAFYMCQEIAPCMIRNQRGRIINIGSVWGRYGASCEVAYSASKAGLRGLTLSLARELGPSNITVNCVEPGVIETDMNACYDEETMDELAESAALCRIGQPSEVANAVYFLASDEASFITAQCLGVDGGFPLG